MSEIRKGCAIGITSRSRVETASLFIVGNHNAISRGALLLVSELPLTPEGVKSEDSDLSVTRQWANINLRLRLSTMAEVICPIS